MIHLLECTEDGDSKLRRDWVTVGETTMHPIPQEPNLRCRPQVLTAVISVIMWQTLRVPVCCLIIYKPSI